MVWYGSSERFYMGQDPSDWNAVLNAWRNAFLKYKAWPFNSVRLPFHMPHQPGCTAEPANQLEELINLCFTNGYQVILCLGNNAGDSIGYFGSDAFVADWVAMAQRYKGDNRIIAFELFNEPWVKSFTTISPLAPWIEASPRPRAAQIEAFKICTDAIRQVDPARTVVWADPNALCCLPNEDDPLFVGWEGPTIDAYTAYAGNMFFSMHRYPPGQTIFNLSNVDDSLQVMFHAVDYIKAKGFKCFFGEFGFTANHDAETGIYFVKEVLNFCKSRGIGWWIHDYAEPEQESQPTDAYYQAVTQSDWPGPPPPATVPITIYSTPFVGIDITVQDVRYTTPFTVNLKVGEQFHIVASEGKILDGISYRFENWTDALGNEITRLTDFFFGVVEATSLTANYVEGEIPPIPPAGPVLKILPSTHGATNPPAGQYVIASGVDIMVTGIPAEGYQVSTWLKDGVDQSVRGTVFIVGMDADHTVQAIFELQEVIPKRSFAARVPMMPTLGLMALKKIRDHFISKEVHKKLHPLV